MSRPKTKGKRRGGRDRQFFTALTGLASGLNKVIEDNKPARQYDPNEAQKLYASKLGAAQAKRERRAERNKKLFHPTNPGDTQ